MKKLADKERRQVEEAHRAKAAALRDDDNVFDVAYEQQGSEGQDVLSATDIKVSLQHNRRPVSAVQVGNVTKLNSAAQQTPALSNAGC